APYPGAVAPAGGRRTQARGSPGPAEPPLAEVPAAPAAPDAAPAAHAAEDGETHEGVPAAGGTVETNRESANRESRATC
ncbi:glycosyltransferase family 1 protein, partial [Streptomyces scabiei]|nr:glycosyltransferase family 1 protein [Streptomyces scabiei]